MESTPAAAPPSPAAGSSTSAPDREDRTGGGKRLHIDTDALRSRWYQDRDGERNRLASDFREIKRPLLARAWGRGRVRAVAGGRRILVASALREEGRTFCAINLALSLSAERDHPVILIDGDVARPSIPRQLGVNAETSGLMDALLDPRRDIERLVRPTNIRRLSILPAGRGRARALELMAGPTMDQLFDRLDEHFPTAVLVIDSPPVLESGAAHLLAGHVGQIVMVVGAGDTTRQRVTQAMARLGQAKITGTILNRAPDDANGAVAAQR